MNLKILFLIVFFFGASALNAGKLPFLKISDNKRYLVTEDGKPFFWLGDTAWELIHRLDKKETRRYLDDRQEKGFTIIQTVILAELDGLRTPNANGDIPLLDNDPAKPNEDYFRHVDFVVRQAARRNLYVALLPTWGDKFNKRWGTGPEVFSPENAAIYGRYLGKRYKDQENIVWVLGGDRGPADEEDRRIIRAMAKGIQAVDKKHLITYHIWGGKRATEYFNEDWLDLEMFQTGHNKQSRDYEFVWAARNIEPVRPVINSEPRYENIPDKLRDPSENGWIDAADVRRSAYWTMLAGAAGFTYGCNDIWQMYSVDRQPVIYARTGWEAAMQLPGAQSMEYLKRLFTAFSWQGLENNQSVILNENPGGQQFIAAATGKEKDILVVYTPVGEKITVDLSVLEPEKLTAYWYNPRSGKTKRIGEFSNTVQPEFTPWSSGEGSDFVLVVLGKDLPRQLAK